MLKKLKKDFFGYVGLILIHSSTFPTIISNIMGTSDELPPLNMILLLFFGLSFYLVDAIKKRFICLHHIKSNWDIFTISTFNNSSFWRLN